MMQLPSQLTTDIFLVKNNPSTVIYQLCRCEQINLTSDDYISSPSIVYCDD